MEKCEAAAKEIRGETLNHRVNARHLDLASLKSIREFAAKVTEGRRAAAGLVREGLSGWAVRRGRTRQVLELSVGHWLFLFSLWVQILHCFLFDIFMFYIFVIFTCGKENQRITFHDI